ncbi:hypothetical protein RIF29_39275 [Crotalaria pallida]|uniref:Uncharacterized protein n=1 Tax=Crotalaria pallida TaxID=3830 RepID=A0AAN9E0Y2_CROPI
MAPPNNRYHNSEDLSDIREFVAFLLSYMARVNAVTRSQFLENHINPETHLIANPVIQPGFRRVYQAPLASTPKLTPEPAYAPAAAPASQPQELEVKVSLFDNTMPYIDQLDTPINNNELVNGDNIYGENPEFPILDLELRL